jgi:hypothetical protein
MKSVKPTIIGLLPAPPIVINIAEGEVFGESGNVQLQVALELTGQLPAIAVASLEIISPQLYRFTDGTSKKQYNIPMNNQQTTVLLDFKIKNLAFFPVAQPTLDVGVFSWEQVTGDSVKRSHFANIAVTVVRPIKLKFKKLLK